MLPVSVPVPGCGLCQVIQLNLTLPSPWFTFFPLSLRAPGPDPASPDTTSKAQQADTLRDTIDLQDHDAPSAKDHRQNHLSTGAHQAETLREVAHESAEEHARSPRLSWNDAADNDDHQQQGHGQDDLAAGVNYRMHQQQQNHQEEQHEDSLAVAQNGGISSSDEGDLDGDDLDDDMMDRISSSPSIEDGAYNLLASQVSQVPPLPLLHLRDRWTSSAGSTSSYLDAPEHLPLQTEQQDSISHHLLRCENDETHNETNDNESWLYGVGAGLAHDAGDGELGLHVAPHS